MHLQPIRHSTSRSSTDAAESDQPTQIFHPSIIPTPGGLFESAASGAHYSGAKVHHRRLDIQRASGSRDPAELRESHQRVINDLKELYCCRPSPAIFSRTWKEDAEYVDPLTHCRGINEVASLWYNMARLFSKSETESTRILSSTNVPNRFIYSQTQHYVLRIVGTKRTLKSIVIVDLDENDKIVRVEDQWNGEEPPSAWGLGVLRRLNGRITPWLVRLPKDMRKSE